MRLIDTSDLRRVGTESFDKNDNILLLSNKRYGDNSQKCEFDLFTSTSAYKFTYDKKLRLGKYKIIQQQQQLWGFLRVSYSEVDTHFSVLRQFKTDVYKTTLFDKYRFFKQTDHA